MNKIEECKEIIDFFDYSKNSEKDLKLSVNSRKKIFFICKSSHSFRDTTFNLSRRKYKCKKCPKPIKKISKDIPKGLSLEEAYPEISSYYSVTKNSLSTDKIHKGSKKKVWWFCEYGHEYDREVYVEVRCKGRCPLCSVARVTPGVNDLATLYPHLIPMWSSNNPKPMNTYSPKNDFKAEWVCSSGHKFLRRVFHQTNGNLLPCPECPKPISFESSVASSDLLMAMWSEVNEEDPKYIKKKSHKILKWNGRNCKHTFEKSVKYMTETHGRCPDCRGTQEDVFANFIENRYKLKLERNKRVLKGDGMNLELDIIIPERNIAIEFNGELWHSNAKFSNKNLFEDALAYHSWKLSKSKDIDLDLKFVWAHDWRSHRDDVIVALDELFKYGYSDSPFLNRLESRFDRRLDCGCSQIKGQPEWLKKTD